MRFPAYALAAFGLVAFAYAAGSPVEAADRRSKDLTVVELFTSQGCSSCPPADAFLGELCRRPGILGLTWPVNYWDYIGWKDTFAAQDFVRRQKSYARSLKGRYVYTPQMVVDGVYDAVGSDRDKVSEMIAKRRSEPRHSVPVSVSRKKDGFVVAVGVGLFEDEATVWLVHYDRKRAVEVGAGENKGRTLVYHNIVRNAEAIGAWRGKALRIAVNEGRLDPAGHDAWAVLVQQGRTGPILGATSFALNSLE